MMLDMFFSCAQVKRKRRVHFHNFMIDVHKRLSAVTIRKFNAGIGIHQWRTTKSPEEHDPIPPLSANLAAEACLLCFDEFQVTYSSLLPLCLVINNWEKVTDVALFFLRALSLSRCMTAKPKRHGLVQCS